jgi:PII-like signaling protein
MDIKSRTRVLRIYLSSTDKYKNEPLFETIVFLAKKNKMAGATVLKGVMGFGASSAVTSTRFWSVSEKLPLIVEIIDEKEKIEHFFTHIKPYLEKVKKGIMVSVEKTDVMMYKSGAKKTD